jgi:2',3'-cyclic-nucleotide 2'-phosphodiesterase (5'-nucleotidase family)
MNTLKFAPILGCLLLTMTSIGRAEDGADVGAHAPSQAAADLIKEFSGADGAFLAAGNLKAKNFQKENLASLLQYPTSTIVVLSLSGLQIKQAFERSISLYPQPNEGFLQVSGFDITFKKTGTPNNRIVSINSNGVKLDESKSYNVAMPSTLAHGGLGYFKIWENAKTVKKFTTTIEDVLKGKHSTDSAPRWVAVS